LLSKYLSVNDDLNIHYLEITKKSPKLSLLLIHGLSSSAFLWTPLVNEFKNNNFDIYAIDLRGHGLSQKPESGYSMDNLSKDITDFIEKKDLNNVIVIGQSLGGDLSVLVSAKSNQRIIGCIGIDGGAINLKKKFKNKDSALKELRPPDLNGIHKDVMLERLRKNKPDWSEDAILGQFSIFEVDKKNLIKKRLKLKNHLKILNSLWDNNPIQNLKKVNVPTLLILVKYNTDLTYLNNLDVKIEVERVSGDHDIHAQKPKLVYELIYKRIKRKFFEKE